MQGLRLRALIAVLALGCGAGLLHVFQALTLPISLDPNEGWNAYHAQVWRMGGALYPAAGGFFYNNYPPLSFVLVGAVGWLIGDDIIAGRIIALLSQAGVLIALIGSLRILCCNWPATLFAALFLLSGFLLFSDYVGIDDPQMLGHAIQMGGLVLILRKRTAGGAVAAALLCAMAFFVKHNLVVLPLVLALWLLASQRRLAFIFAAAYVLAIGAGIGLCALCLHVNLLMMIASARSYSFDALIDNAAAWLAYGLVPLAVLGMLIGRTDRRDPALRLCVVYAAAGCLAGLYFLGGAGVDANAMFDADIALALSVGLALHHGKRSVLLGLALMLPLGLGLLRTDLAWASPSFWLRPYAGERGDAAADIAFIRDRPGPALCATLALCYWAGKPPAVDVFNLGQAYRMHARSDGPLRAEIEAGRFAVIQFDADDPDPLGPGVAQALAQRYRLDRTDDTGFFWTPR